MPPQCAFREGTRRCRKNGTGNPPLCATHRLIVNEDVARQAQAAKAVFDVVQDFVKDPSATINRIFASFRPMTPTDLDGDIDDDPAPRRAPPRSPPPPPRRPAPPPPPKDDARVVLGFPPGIKLTETMIKDRRRRFAAIVHPDANGSEETMKRINDAATTLLAELKPKR
jgi:hypothetical protein